MKWFYILTVSLLITGVRIPIGGAVSSSLGFAKNHEVVTAESAVLQDSPFSGFPTVSFSSIILAMKNSFAWLFSPSPKPIATAYPAGGSSKITRWELPPPWPSFLSRLFSSVRNFFSGNKTPSKKAGRPFPKPHLSEKKPPLPKAACTERPPPPRRENVGILPGPSLP